MGLLGASLPEIDPPKLWGCPMGPFAPLEPLVSGVESRCLVLFGIPQKHGTLFGDLAPFKKSA